MRLKITSPENLARLLLERGFHPDMRCDGRGRCGGCRVKLLSGHWECDGRPVSPPQTVPACRTHLVGVDDGEIEFSFSVAAPMVEKACPSAVLPKSPEPVAAFDIGTTTLAAAKIRDGKVISSAGCLNPQSRFGDDVLTRIVHADSPEGADELQRTLLDALRGLAGQLGLSDVKRAAVSGNTVMLCLLHGVSPHSIGEYPFSPPRRAFPVRGDLLPPLQLFTVPCISGYLGGDVTAGLYAAKPAPDDMLVDLGTNCEIVFNTGNGWFGTSAAAGPAFEGVGLRSGLRAVAGAADHYYGPDKFSVIGGGAPLGFCGSAYVDYLAVERRAGRIDEFGRFVSPREPLREPAPGVFIGEDDVEQLLKAKAAVRTGIDLLERHFKVKAKRLLLAGGFASGLDTDNASAVGMLPPDREIVRIGNSSLFGAAALAADPYLSEELARLSGLPRELPLAELPGFDSAFIDALLLP